MGRSKLPTGSKDTRTLSASSTQLATSGKIPEIWTVERLDIDGEELSILRHTISWAPAPLALRYALRMRFALSPSSLFSELRGICILYNWTEVTADIGNIETFLISGGTLNKNALLQLATQLRRQHDVGSSTLTRPKRQKEIVSTRVFNLRLFAVSKFLEWAMEPSNHGGYDLIDEDALDAQISKTIRVLDGYSLPVSESPRREPLTPIEIQLIRQAIAPDEFGEFPPGVFTKRTRYRNWCMFESALNLGTRKGELLTLRESHLPASKEDVEFLIPRQQDEAEDPRKRRRPRGKTNERKVPLADPILLPSILRYRDSGPPIGRNDRRIKTRYLFVGKDGRPVASTTADYIIKKIGEYAACLVDNDPSIDEINKERLKESLRRLTWHRLRHTWAENAALVLYEKYGEGAWAILKEWGGWNSIESLNHYIRHARRLISYKASEEYLSGFGQRNITNDLGPVAGAI